MAKVKFEFHCTECNKYFDFKLDTSLNGNYRIHCPNCGHIHYRKVSKGQITADRFDRNPTDPLLHDIRPMKSSCRDIQHETFNDSNAPDAKVFMWQLWRDRFSARV